MCWLTNWCRGSRWITRSGWRCWKSGRSLRARSRLESNAFGGKSTGNVGRVFFCAGLQLLQSFHQIQIRKPAAVGIHERFFVGRNGDSLNRVHARLIGRSNLLPDRSLPSHGIHARNRDGKSHGIVDEERAPVSAPTVDGFAGFDAWGRLGLPSINREKEVFSICSVAHHQLSIG